MRQLDIIAEILLIIGGLNWGLDALPHFEHVAAITGAADYVCKNAFGIFIYTLVALAAVYYALGWKAIQHRRFAS
jgi:uncharacterized membrane protein YuzA (DUF378 family)